MKLTQIPFLQGYLAHRLDKMKTRNILTAFFALFSFPVLMLGLIQRSADFDLVQNVFVGRDGLLIFNVCVVVFVFMLTGFFLVMYANGIMNFDYNLKRSEIDRTHALPVKYRDRFWIDFVSGILPTVLFYSISVMLSLIIYNLFKTPEIEQIIAMNLNWDNIWGFLLSGLVFLIGSYVFTVLSASLCGRMFEASWFPLVIAILLPAIVFLSGTLMFDNVLDSVTITDELADIVAVVSPAGLLINAFVAGNENVFSIYRLNYEFPVYRVEIMLPVLIILTAITIFSYFNGKHRKTENIGKAFAVPYAYNITLGMVIFAIVSFMVFYDTDINVFSTIIVTAVAYFVIEVITKHGIKKPKTMLLRYAGMVVSSFVLSSVFMMFNGFGSAYYIPLIEEIESVGISGNSSSSEFTTSGYWGLPFIAEFSMDSDNENEREMAEYIRDLHQNSISNSEETKINEYAYVVYKLKDGRRIVRGIWYERLNIYPVFNDQLYKEKQVEWFENDYNTNNMKLGGYIISQTQSVHNSKIILNIKVVNELYEALKKDFLAENEPSNIALNENTAPFAVVNLIYERGFKNYMSESFYKHFYVKPSYSNTLAVLEKNNIEIPDMVDYVKTEPFYMYYSDYIDFAYGSTYDWNYEWKYECVDFQKAVIDGNENALKLLSVMQPICLTNDSGYIIASGFNVRYVIPPMYKQFAEELYNDLKNSGYLIYVDRWMTPLEKSDGMDITVKYYN